MATWPVQSNCLNYYGNPRAKDWEAANLVSVPTPWNLFYEGKPVSGIRVHKKCADSFKRVLAAIWKRLGQSQEEIDRIGMSRFSGSFNIRPMTNGTTLSMHSYGCAIDFDASNNGYGDSTPAMDRRVVEEFEREGWEWGGHWKTKDGMHFQAAWTRVNPPRLGALTVVPATTKKQLTVVSKKASILTVISRLAKAVAGAAGGIFTADNLGLFTGWLSPFSGLGQFAILIGVCVLGYWLLSDVLLKMMANDHDEGRYTPSGAVPVQETPNGVVEQPV